MGEVKDRPYQVAIVVDPHFGPSLIALSQRMHVWCSSPPILVGQIPAWKIPTTRGLTRCTHPGLSGYHLTPMQAAGIYEFPQVGWEEASAANWCEELSLRVIVTAHRLARQAVSCYQLTSYRPSATRPAAGPDFAQAFPLVVHSESPGRVLASDGRPEGVHVQSERCHPDGR